jgi:hypothetical protein
MRHGLAFIFCVAAVSHACPGQGVEAAGLGARERVLAVAVRLIGVREATGKNDGPVIEAILRSAGASKGDPYCAAFNYWCYSQAGLAALVPRSAWSPDWLRKPTWTLARSGLAPQPADAFGLYFPSKGRIAHTGLIRKWGSSATTTVEANTSPEAAPGTAADRDGGGIWSKRRLTRQIHSVRNWID